MTRSEAKTISAAQARRIERTTEDNIQRAALASAARATSRAPSDGMPGSSIRCERQVARLPGSDLAFEVEIWSCQFGDMRFIARDEQDALTWVQGRKAMWHNLNARGRARALIGKRLCDLANRVTAAVDEATALCCQYTAQDLLSPSEDEHITEITTLLRHLGYSMPDK
jgi:hypothetical protein